MLCGAEAAVGEFGAPVAGGDDGSEDGGLVTSVFGIVAAVTLIWMGLCNKGVPVSKTAVLACSGSVNSTIQYFVSAPNAGPNILRERKGPQKVKN